MSDISDTTDKADFGAAFTPMRELGELVRTRQASSVELAEGFLDRLERIGPRYNAVVATTRERALREARASEARVMRGEYRGPLDGLPYGAKDLLATADAPATWGAAPFQDQRFDYDAGAVRKLGAAGAVLAAKLAMVELAGGMGYRQPNASFTGPARTPWGKDAWAGGSSSGSGAAVAAGLTPFAIGSETWGSILSPANNCGVSGLRPTYGRVSRHGAMALSWTLDKLGPLCLTADDCGLALEAMAGPDPDDPATADMAFQYDAAPPETGKRFRIGVVRDIDDGAQDDVKRNFRAALRTLESVADVEEIVFPDMPYEAITRTILNAESASAFDDFIESGRASELTAPEDRHPYARTLIPAQDYIRALRLRRKVAAVADDLMLPYDALAAPSRATTATPIDQDFRGVVSGGGRDLMGAVGNAAGLPSIGVPSGFSDEGLPTGIQFMGRAYDENRILAVARAYQSLTDWHARRPPGV